MNLRSLLSHWRAEPSVAENISAWEEFPARPANTSTFPINLHPALAQALIWEGISSLYTHQSSSWQHAQAGRHVLITAGTASGKSLCYNLPILDGLLRGPETRALYLFPTKALTQDQLASLERLLDSLEPALRPPMAIYDGDTPARHRPAIRSSARLLLTNPDMLHLGILPHHTDWASFFRNLRYVVLDETHIYRGVFGSHLANVLRRLRRIAHFYNAELQFFLTSATLANPLEFASLLVEAPVTIIDQDGSGHGPKTFLIYNPPLIDPQLGLRRSALQESVRLIDDLLAYRVQTIAFGRSRPTVELILSYLRDKANSSGYTSKATEQIRGYRSGYLPAQRREIEHGLRQGSVRAVVATNALELGIDIGGMGAAVLVGYPGTIASTRQQAGRAGRGSESSLAVLVATADPIDQYLAAHPDYLFKSTVEHALINPDNLLVLLEHIRCAAFELPFQSGDDFGSVEAKQVSEILEFLVQQGTLHKSGKRYFWMADRYPAQAVSLRSISGEPILLQIWEDGKPTTIGLVDRGSAFRLAHPQAIYLHEAQTYLVEVLDLEQNTAHLSPVNSDYYTEPRSVTTVALVEKRAELPVHGALKAHGELLVTSQVTSFQKIRWYTYEVIGQLPLELPPSELLTDGYWFVLEESVVEHLRESGLWRNDPNDYGSGWDQLRERVRQRDGFRCQICGALEQGRAHDVHHKLPFRLFASPEQANRMDNLTTLCPTCHHRVEAAVRVRSGLAGLTYALGHMAPFFLMCDMGDLGVHSDAQLDLAEGKPAIVLYDQAPGGIGLSQRLYELHDEILTHAKELVSTCACKDGCPSCIGPGGQGLAVNRAGDEVVYGGKRETLALLEVLTFKGVEHTDS
jgi:DEAD/DEAH box helicase domain-containing protein